MDSSIDAMLAQALTSALAELRTKSLCDIQFETAITWAGRAVASYSLYAESGNVERLLAAEEFAHESLEHSALADPGLYLAIHEHLESVKRLAHSMRAR